MTESALTIGKFDGFHLGHQLLFDNIKEHAASNGLRTVCLKLDFGNQGIFSKAEADRFSNERLGIDALEHLYFSPEFGRLSPCDFVANILVERYAVKHVAVGDDFRFGYGRAGDTKLLQELGKEYGFSVSILEKLRIDDEIVSSTRIRKLMQEGKMPEAESLLGHPYYIQGYVENGKKLGRTLGYPTINLSIENDKLLPKYGVYATRVKIGNKDIYSGITNIGIRPSIDDGNVPTVETFIYDFDKDIYGEEVLITAVKYIRPERRFDGLAELTEQISKDIESSRIYLNI